MAILEFAIKTIHKRHHQSYHVSLIWKYDSKLSVRHNIVVWCGVKLTSESALKVCFFWSFVHTSKSRSCVLLSACCVCDVGARCGCTVARMGPCMSVCTQRQTYINIQLRIQTSHEPTELLQDRTNHHRASRRVRGGKEGEGKRRQGERQTRDNEAQTRDGEGQGREGRRGLEEGRKARGRGGKEGEGQRKLSEGQARDGDGQGREGRRGAEEIRGGKTRFRGVR